VIRLLVWIKDAGQKLRWRTWILWR